MTGLAVTGLAVCADVGSTYTKVAIVDLEHRRLVSTAEHPTTVDTDVLDGLDAAVAQAGRGLPAADLSTVYACSSAGGGLRLAVVGYEQLVTAEAGQRVGLTAGARVVHVAAGPLDRSGLAALTAARPDVVLLVGGTDGGDSDVLRHNAHRLAGARLAASPVGRRGPRGRLPVVLAGNAEVRDELAAALAGRGTPVVATANVLPRIGELNPQPAREAIRRVFLRHVIGGKGLSRGPRFARLVRAATPDAVLTGVELLADHLAGDLLVVDIGGATTDVYSVCSPDPDEAAPAREVPGTLWHARTVEGDLGVRCNAPGVVAAARAEGLVDTAEAERLTDPARTRADDPAYLPSTGTDQTIDVRLAGLAALIALRRHARGDRGRTSARGGAVPMAAAMTGNDQPGRDTETRPPRAAEAQPGGGNRPGRRDLRRVRLLVGSGGVLRHAPEGASSLLGAVLTDHAGGWALPRAAAVAVDRDYVLAPAGLLAARHPETAMTLLRDHLTA